MKKQNIFLRITNFIRYANISLVLSVPSALGFLMVAGYLVLIAKPFSGQPIEVAFATLIFFFWGATGLIIFIRQEAPGWSPINAGAFGFMMMVLFWGLAILAILRSFGFFGGFIKQ